MKTKISPTRPGTWLAWLAISPACICCIMTASAGTLTNVPNGPEYQAPSAQWTPGTNSTTPTNIPITPGTDMASIVAAWRKAHSPAAVTFTNGAVVGFDVLAGYNINLAPELENNTNRAWADAQVNALIPANIRALDHREVSVDGFMIPVEIENGKLVEFLVARNPPACCYGGVPLIHEWVKVRVKPPGVEFEDYNIVRAHGILSVGAERVDGALTSIYRMAADKVGIAPDR